MDYVEPCLPCAGVSVETLSPKPYVIRSLHYLGLVFRSPNFSIMLHPKPWIFSTSSYYVWGFSSLRSGPTLQVLLGESAFLGFSFLGSHGLSDWE